MNSFTKNSMNNSQLISKRTDNQYGFTLVEIMVAITIGLVMMAGIMQISLANRESARLQRNMGFVQQNIRTAMDLLVRDIQQAGYYDRSAPVSPVNSNTAGNPITPFLNVVAPTAVTTAAVTADGGITAGVSNNDQITLTYEVSTEAPKDCLGGTPTNATAPAFASPSGEFVVNHYFISGRRLMCRGNDGIAQPLVEGVESLQILYGVNTDGDPRTANRYVQAHQVATGGLTMADVVSVRLGMRFISRDSVRQTADTNSYALLDATAVTPGGRFMRREMTTTISLRNE
jgi:type IV pilus assembly protein PilW